MSTWTNTPPSRRRFRRPAPGSTFVNGGFVWVPARLRPLGWTLVTVETPTATKTPEARRAVPRPSNTTLIAIALSAGLCAIYTTFSLIRHSRMETAAYDLGIFDQAVRAYSRLDAPIVPIKGPGANLLGDHFHPILATLAPLYWLWADPRMLLIAQAALLALSVIPISRLAISRLGYSAGITVGVAYGLSWGVQGAIAFDFHEIAFAVPLLACALVNLSQERWGRAVAWALPLLLVKEDLGLIVVAIGAYLVLKKRYRLGVTVVLTGVIALTLVIAVIIPHFSWSGKYRYWAQMNAGGRQSTLQTVFDLPASLFEQPQKLLLLLCLLAITGFAALRSPLLVIALPVVLYRIASTHPLQWSVGEVHYNAILMPIMFVALLDAVTLLQRSPRKLTRRYARVIPVAVGGVAIAMLPFFSFWRFTDSAFYRPSGHVSAAHRLMAEIPTGARVAASNFLAVQLTGRCRVTLFADVYRRPVDWVIVDSTRLSGIIPAPAAVQQGRLQSLPNEGFRLVRQENGILLFRRA